jgi:hypothetical protein
MTDNGNGKSEKSLKTRFSANGAQLTIALRGGKKGFNVSATLRQSGSKSLTGTRSIHEKREDAVAEYEKLVADATSKGWAPKTKKSKASSAFSEIPAPTALPEKVAPKAKAAKAAKSKAKK